MSGLVQYAENDSCDDLMRWRNDPLTMFFRVSEDALWAIVDTKRTADLCGGLILLS